MFEITKKVPVPPSGSPGNHSKYPWGEMSPGDSFLVPAKNGDAARRQKSLLGCVRQRAMRHGEKYTTRCVDGGVRVWRIE